MRKLSAQQSGDVGELAFMLAATKQKYRVLTPYGISEGYDFVIDNGLQLLKVQVKAANWTTCKGYSLLQFFLTSRLANLKSKASKFDVLACYDLESGDFYFMQSSKIVGSTVSFSSKTKKYAEKNNWALLKALSKKLSTTV